MSCVIHGGMIVFSKMDPSNTVDRREPETDGACMWWLLVPWAVLLYLTERFFHTWTLPVALAFFFVLSVPAAATAIYLGGVAQCRRLTMFAHKGVLYGLLSGRWLRIIFWSSWAVLTGLFTVLEMKSYIETDWFGMLAVLPVFWALFWVFRRLFSKELRPYLVTRNAILMAQWLTPVVVVVLYLGLLRSDASMPVWDSVREAVEAERHKFGDAKQSVVLHEASAWMVYFFGIKAYALGRAASMDDWLIYVVLGFGKFIVFLNVCAVFACFIIPRREFGRAFAKPSDADDPGTVSAGRAAYASVLGLLPVVVLAFYATRLERWLQHDQRPALARARIEAQMAVAVERIDHEIFRKGTIAQIQAVRSEAMRQLQEKGVLPLKNAVDGAFVDIEGGVDAYLDGYYSLWGDYARLVSIVSGGLAEHMGQKLEEALHAKEAFAKVESAYQGALLLQEEIAQIVDREVFKIKEANRLPVHTNHVVVNNNAKKLVLNFPEAPELIGFKNRMAMSSGVGLASGVIAGGIVGRIVNNALKGPVFKLAVRVVEKVLARTVSRAAGASGGAAAGAIAGSWVPGIGTGIGATVGLVVGLLSSVAVDKLLIEIEEQMNREKYREEIIASIRATKEELMRGVFLPVP